MRLNWFITAAVAAISASNANAQSTEKANANGVVATTAVAATGAAVETPAIDRQSERNLSEAFFPRTMFGTHQSCSARAPAGIGESRLELKTVVDRINACYEALLENGDPYLNRRMAYSGIASGAAFGGSIAAGIEAASGTVSWFGGAALLPMLIEGTFDRPEFDAVDRVTARGLNWVNARTVELEAYQRLAGAQQIELRDRINEVIRLRDSQEFAAIQTRLRDEAGSQSDDGAEEGEPDPVRSLTALEGLMNSVNQFVYQGRNVEHALADDREHLDSVLPSWANERFRHVMETYQDSRRQMTLRPQAAIRNVLALPLTTVANVIRGGAQMQEQEYFGTLAARDLRDLGRPLRLREAPAAGSTPITVTLADYASGDRRKVQELMRAVEAAQVEMEEANRLMADLRRVNSGPAPDFSVPGSTREQSEEAGAAQQRAANAEEPAPAPDTQDTSDQPTSPPTSGGGK